MGPPRPRPAREPLRGAGALARRGDGARRRGRRTVAADAGSGAERAGSAAAGPVLLYDGACGFCGAAVGFVLRRDRRRTLRFAPLAGAYAAGVAARHPVLAGADSMIWVEPAGAGVPERVFARSAAALRVARYLGGAWTLARAAWLIPRPLRDAAYDLLARHRHRLSGGTDACFVPAPEVRERFLDAP